MDELLRTDVRGTLNLFFFQAGFKVCVFARIGNHRPCLRFHLGAFRDASPSAGLNAPLQLPSVLPKSNH